MVKFSKPKGQRIKKSHKRPMWIEPLDKVGWQFNTTRLVWQRWEDFNETEGCTTVYYAMGKHGLRDVYSLKAAIRLINSWEEVPDGFKFYVRLPWVGHHFIISKNK